MFKSALSQSQLYAFFAGFLFSAALTGVIRNPASMMWISFAVLSFVMGSFSRRYSSKLVRKLPQITEIKYSD